MITDLNELPEKASVNLIDDSEEVEITEPGSVFLTTAFLERVMEGIPTTLEHNGSELVMKGDLYEWRFNRYRVEATEAVQNLIDGEGFTFYDLGLVADSEAVVEQNSKRFLFTLKENYLQSIIEAHSRVEAVRII